MLNQTGVTGSPYPCIQANNILPIIPVPSAKMNYESTFQDNIFNDKTSDI